MNDVPAWAARLRAERHERLWTQREMAKRLADAADEHVRLPERDSLTRNIKDWEAGKHHPKDPYPILYSRVFQVDETKLFGKDILAGNDDKSGDIGIGGTGRCPESSSPGPLADGMAANGETLDCLTLAWTVGRLDQRMERRGLLQLAATVTASAALDPSERLIRALAGDHRPDGVTVGHLEDRTRGFHRLEGHLPAAVLYPALMSHLGDISALLESSSRDVLRQRLAVTAGESAVLAGWFAWEMGKTRQVASMSRLVNVAAKHGRDPAITAIWAGYRTYTLGRKRVHAPRLAAAAIEQVGDSAPATRVYLLARLAEESAFIGDRKTAIAAIGEAEDLYPAADITSRPWTFFLDAARFASMALAVYTRVHHEEKAAAALDAIVTNLGPEPEIKKLCVLKAEMAIARLRLGDVTGGVTSARSSLAATEAMAAPLGWERLDQTVHEMRRFRTVAAREFRAEYAAIRPREALSSPH
ncbi:hypothetical protein Sru01_12140 [Sphaerisporangium rufum]|uniref:XRE family transcriptional regulator n=1 Tax=Sphaerisporangium rufum TaxID=1381558 RepID=A0A919QYB4_9ACTN|nr:hypothetical protein [Sphaerisporangium rufum]GII76232.1 hypothetical protein Sru01_12140 [Sphaerisporangium rufum]